MPEAQSQSKQILAIIDSIRTSLINYHLKCAAPCLADSAKVDLLNDLGYFFAQGKLDSAIIYCRQGLTLAEKIGWMRGKTDALVKLGDFFRLRGNFDSSSFYNNQVLTMSEKAGGFREQKMAINTGVAYYTLALVLKEKGNMPGSNDYLEKSIAIFKIYNDRRRIANSLASLGTNYNELGKYPEAINFHLQSLKIKQDLKDLKGVGIAYGNIGIIYDNLKNYDKAIEYYIKSAAEFEAAGDPMSAAINITNLGKVYLEKKDPDAALQNFENALARFKLLKGMGYVPIVLSNIAAVYQEKKEFEKAMAAHQEALRLKTQLNLKRSMGISMLNIGSIYSETGKLDSAEKYLSAAYAIATSNNYTDDIKDIQEELYKLYYSKNDFKRAFNYYEMFIKTKDSLLNDENRDNIERQLLNFEFEKKQDSASAAQEKRMAIVALEKKNALEQAEKKRLLEQAENNLALAAADNKRMLAETEKQTIVSEAEKQRLLTEAEKKLAVTEADKKRVVAEAYAKEQRSARNFILAAATVLGLSSIFIFFFYKRKRDAEQKQKETALSLQVSETEMKALRSQMNPHFIFNALQSIQTFLISHQPDDANRYLLLFSRLMRLVLENSQHSEVSLKDDMEALELYMQLESIRLTHPFTYKFHIAPNINIEDDTIPPLILQPFVENAIWHGLQYKPGPGHIDIYISKKGSALHATVEDNGVGRDLSRKTAQPIFIKKESLGMKLTEERLSILNKLKNMKAYFTITDLFTTGNHPAGTKVELSLPLAT